MINDLDIVQWEYLLSPEFELINSAGKPLTGGWIEVYLHGTRNKYYCASDFDGTLHPFKIPLDSIGANVVLADPNNAYDVYVYNKFGSLIMSRYNVKCQGSGGSSTYVGDKLYYGQYRANNVTTIANLRRNKGNISITDDGYLKLKSDMSYHITVRGSFTIDDPANEDTTLNYIEYTSVNPIKIDIDETKEGPQYFELSYDIYCLQEDMDYQVAFTQSNGLVKDLIVEVHSLSNLATSATGGGQEYEPGWGIDITNNVVSVDPSIFEDYTYTGGNYISIDGDNVISVTGINPADYATHDEVYEATVTAVQLATGAIPEEEEVDFQEINLNDYALASAIPDVSDFASHTEVYEATVTAIDYVTGIIPEAQVQSDWNQNDSTQPDYIKNKPTIPSIEGLATVEQVSVVSGYLQNEIDNIPAQVQSDWTEDDNTDPAYIKNKPDEYNLVAGDNIAIAVTGTDIVISSTGGGSGSTYTAGTGIDIINNTISVDNTVAMKTDIPAVSEFATKTELYAVAAEIPTLPDDQEVVFEELDLSDYALASTVPVVSGLATKTELAGVEAEIPTIQLNSNDEVISINNYPIHSEGGGGGSTYTAGDHISIENDEIAVTGITELVPGDGITITTSGASAIINSIAQDDNIFWAIYGTTTYDEVKAAHTAGKKIVMYDSDGNVVGLTQHDGTGGSTERFHFCWVQKVWQPGGPTLKYAYICKRDGWYRSYTAIQADWNVTHNYHPGYIKNKPTIPNYTGASGIDITNDVISVDNTVAMKTDIPDVSMFATKSDVQTVSAAIPDTTDMATQTWVDNQGYLTSVPSNYVTDSELNGAVSELATKTEVTTGLGTKQNTLTGITDVQVVQSLPVSPVSTVLYLIPEA